MFAENRMPQMCGQACGLVCRHIVCYFRMFAKREAKRLPYKRDFIQRRRAGACSRRIVVRSIFRPRTNERPPSISVGEGLAPPVLCSHNPSAEKKRTVSLYLGRGRRLRRPEKTLIYNGLSRAPAPTAFLISSDRHHIVGSRRWFLRALRASPLRRLEKFRL